jgi:hypothetical protein
MRRLLPLLLALQLACGDDSAPTAPLGGSPGSGDSVDNPDAGTPDGGVDDDGELAELDPDRAHHFGYLNPSKQTQPAIGIWSRPMAAWVGIPHAPRVLTGLSGEPVYLVSTDEGFALRVGKHDPFTRTEGARVDVEDNDEPIATACEPAAAYAVPESDEVVYGCLQEGMTPNRQGDRCLEDPCAYHHEDGMPFDLPEGARLIHIGVGRHALVSASEGLQVYSAESKATASLSGDTDKFSPDFAEAARDDFDDRWISVRARDDGFWVAYKPDAAAWQRFHISFEGKVTLEGAYPPAPMDIAFIRGGWCTLEASGALICVGETPPLLEYILELPLDGAEAIIRQEELSANPEPVPFVQLAAGSRFVTGP